ncbi:hypothetical protein [Roseovarius sp. SYSU LYC5161]
MNHTRESMRRVFAPGAVILWLALIIAAVIADRIVGVEPVDPKLQREMRE